MALSQRRNYLTYEPVTCNLEEGGCNIILVLGKRNTPSILEHNVETVLDYSDHSGIHRVVLGVLGQHFFLLEYSGVLEYSESLKRSK